MSAYDKNDFSPDSLVPGGSVNRFEYYDRLYYDPETKKILEEQPPPSGKREPGNGGAARR